ncbi:hypothetical protein TK35_08475 [Lacticaseibacillus paracasei]|uniref:DUF1642 domain-containing protein n=1 Tax=Lacticaseibacillus paracasei TaxID=1597 RepID=UPI0010636D5C|nr:DUF1642 domain-containing protein [Lacticaseibacillus paracasei]TEA89006.1 hypothetical protein TK35_08475 [Lacticaseibacillus paracasei]TEA91124.1 hypothetical protein TK36_08550 [Lacticaseibacillus paracasei]
MSEEKLYAVKNDEGEWLDQDRIFGQGAWAKPNKDEAELKAKVYGGHVVALVEEPEKVVLTKEQAEIVENARDEEYPATYISNNSDVGASGEEKLLMEAFVNGYTVAKEKKYNVKVPHTKDVWYFKASEAYLLTIFPAGDKKLRGKFTESEIEHYGLQDCEKVEVTDDEQ